MLFGGEKPERWALGERLTVSGVFHPETLIAFSRDKEVATVGGEVGRQLLQENPLLGADEQVVGPRREAKLQARPRRFQGGWRQGCAQFPVDEQQNRSRVGVDHAEVRGPGSPQPPPQQEQQDPPDDVPPPSPPTRDQKGPDAFECGHGCRGGAACASFRGREKGPL